MISQYVLSKTAILSKKRQFRGGWPRCRPTWLEKVSRNGYPWCLSILAPEAKTEGSAPKAESKEPGPK